LDLLPALLVRVALVVVALVVALIGVGVALRWLGRGWLGLKLECLRTEGEQRGWIRIIP
jgi:hypothetical protein